MTPRRSMTRSSAAIGLVLWGMFGRGVAAGQSSAPAAPRSPAAAPSVPAVADLPANFAGPPPPVPPAVFSRDAAGRVTIRAVRVMSPIRIDGHLDESVYSSVQAVSDFIQIDPHEGEPATQKT